MINQTISVAEAKKNLSEILGKVAFGKKQILITKRGRPMACLVPADSIEKNLADVQGWLDEDDSFFSTINLIVKDREKHIPRILIKGNQEK
jgi:prevent-host-death family protein